MMKRFKKIIAPLLLILLILNCEDSRDLQFLETAALPTDITAAYTVTQDNTGLVTITPSATNASSFDIFLGDGTEDPVSLLPGESVDNIYAEGTYEVRIVAYNINGESNEADFATMYDFYTGDPATTDPLTANIGESLSYLYPNPGTYSIRIVAKGAAIETTEYTEDFEVTEILEPLAGAPAPPGIAPIDAISLFSDSFNDVTVDTWNTVWSQSNFEDVDIDGNPTKKYTNLNFNGIETVASPVDASAMEFIHLDIWTPNVTEFRLKLVDFLGDGFGGGNGDT
jgi:hypothetical protein